MKSLRLRLVVGILAGVTLFLAASGVIIYELVRGRMIRETDRALTTVAQTLRTAVNLELGRRARDGILPRRADIGLPDSVLRLDAMFQVRIGGGAALAKSDRLGEAELPWIDSREPLEYREAELPDGRAGRLVSLRFLAGPEPRRDGVRPGDRRGDRPAAGRPPRRRPADGRPPRARPPRPLLERAMEGPPVDGRTAGRAIGDAAADEVGKRGDDGGEREEAEDGDTRDAGGRSGESFPDDRWHAFAHLSPRRVEIVVARDMTELRGTLAHLRWLLVLAWAVTTLGSAGIVATVVGVGLRPLGRLREQIERTDEGRLDRPFRLERAPAELAPVVDQLNAFLARIGRAFEREQRFAADAAHELRTPLAGLRSTLELALARERSSEEYREAASDSLAMTLELQGLVEALLELARAGSAPDAEAFEAVDVEGRVARSFSLVSDRAEARGVTLACEVEPGLRVRTDPALFGRLLDNLVENAVSHGDAGGAVRVTARREVAVGAAGGEDADRDSASDSAADPEPGFAPVSGPPSGSGSDTGGGFVVSVSNPLSRTVEGLTERAFDAFWRAEAARSERAHAGLGLAICRRVADALDLELTIAHEGGVFTATVRGRRSPA